MVEALVLAGFVGAFLVVLSAVLWLIARATGGSGDEQDAADAAHDPDSGRMDY